MKLTSPEGCSIEGLDEIKDRELILKLKFKGWKE